MEETCLENQLMILKSNYNFPAFVYSEMISQLYVSTNSDFLTTCICDDTDNIQMKIIKKITPKDKFENITY